MATPVHYIRTIHTSFTAAHPHSSSAWASPRTHAQLLSLTAVCPPGLHGPANNVVGRKRSASIRAVPPSYVQRIQPQRAKFDPFAEDSDPSLLYNSYHPPPPRNLGSRTTPSIPYTIHIPPAAPADIQRHYQQQQQYRQHQQHQQQYHHHSQPVRVRSPQPQSPKLPPQRMSTPAPVPAPAPAPTPAPATPKAIAAPVPNPAIAAREREARSKIVAGILLNRVHAVGKPMRRRSPSADQPRPYVPSGLSTCIAVEL